MAPTHNTRSLYATEFANVEGKYDVRRQVIGLHNGNSRELARKGKDRVERLETKGLSKAMRQSH